ncbi:MAG: glycoside hydrolase family 2 TIM barrel-domain containing protein [Sphingopyxis sp.]
MKAKFWQFMTLIVSVYLALLSGAAQASPAPPPPVLTAADLRPHIDLSGPWNWSIDPYRVGVSGFHGGEAGYGSRRYDDMDVEGAVRANPRALIEYDMDRAPTAMLPSSWLTHSPLLRHYQGLMWYHRIIDVHPRVGTRTFLRFGAVNYAAAVYVNGALVGRHEGGFAPFAFDVTAQLRAGANRITVGVDSTARADTIPPSVTDWENYGGITRAVSLIEVPETYIDDAWVRLTDDGRIKATLRLVGDHAAGARVAVRIGALGLTMRGRTDGQGNWSGSVAAPGALRRWSPDAPTLYDVEARAGADILNDRIGLRTIAVRGSQILLNGQPIFLRGISLHEEELGADPSRTITPQAARDLLSLVKHGLHGNFVRLAHYPHSEVMTRMADEMGLIVWSEIPVYWLVAWDNGDTLRAARRMLAENILRDRNRASIALWSVGNETPVSDARNAFLRTLIADVRGLDDSRLVTAALLNRREMRAGRVTMVIDDPLVDDLDVLAVNTYNGWYSDDRLAALPDFDWASDSGKPLILSEFGADALAGLHDMGADPRKFSEEYQADYYRQTLAMADRIPFLAGMSPWILKDFRSPRRQHPTFQRGWNRKGLVSETGERKLAFGVLADHYRQRAARVIDIANQSR